MTLQVLPPELLEQPKDRIETKEPQPYWKPSSLKDGESEEFRLLGCYETGHAIMGWQYASEAAGPDGELKFNGYVVTRSHPGTPAHLARETDWSKPDRPKIDGSFCQATQVSLPGLLLLLHVVVLEVLFIEQKSLREQLTEILQEIEDYTWTEDGLANFSIKISVRELVWKLHTASYRRCEKYQQRSWPMGISKRYYLASQLLLKAKILLMASK